MLARYVQKGDSIDYRPSSAVAAGDVVVIADLVRKYSGSGKR